MSFLLKIVFLFLLKNDLKETIDNSLLRGRLKVNIKFDPKKSCIVVSKMHVEYIYPMDHGKSSDPEMTVYF